MKKLIAFLLTAVLLFSFSCKKKPIGPVSEKPTFIIYGVVVKDMNIQKDIASFAVWRNDTLYSDATVKVGDKTIDSIGTGLYYKEFADTTFKRNTAYVDSIISSQDTVTITFSFTMPDTFRIYPLAANDSLNVGGHSVNVIWSASTSASGHTISVAKADTLSGARLYSETLSGTQATIPPTAFRNTSDQLIIGYYSIYIVAYNRSFVSYPGMLFELPSGLPADNITDARGTIGAGVIARKATIYVTTTQ